MSDVREVSEYHEWHAGTLYGISERIDDAFAVIAKPILEKLSRILNAL